MGSSFGQVVSSAALGIALVVVFGTLAIIGAVLFYISDATLAWDKFRRPVKHAAIVTMGVYWVGQIGIVLAARMAS